MTSGLTEQMVQDGKDHEEEEPGHSHEELNKPHDDLVNNAAEVARDCAQGDTKGHHNNFRCYTDSKREGSSKNGSCQDVSATEIRTKWMDSGRWLTPSVDVRRTW